MLLEALGDLFRQMKYVAIPDVDAKQLASRAYLKASYGMADSTAKEAYRRLAERALGGQSQPGTDHDQLPLAELESAFRRELADAEQWYDELRAKEVGWIRDGLNPEAEFDKLYTAEPTVIDTEPVIVGLRPAARATLAVAVGAVGVAFLVGYIIVRAVRGT